MTVALGTNIANPISTALSQWLGFDTMGKLANYGKLGVTDPDAVIEALYANDEQGAWYDPSDLTTMFQDRAGTIQVTADGQTVGKILDKSGRGNHATAPSDAARPLYKTSGGLHWLQFDGVNNSLSTAAINFSSTDKMSVFNGVQKLTNTGDQMFLELSPGGSNGSFYNLGPASGGQNYQFALKGSTDPTATFIDATTFNAPIKNVLSVLYDTAGALRADEIKPRVNGVVPTLAGGGAVSCGSGPFGTFSLFIGSRNNAGVYFGGYIYSTIVLGRTATTQEITDTETWINGKTGAY